MNLFEYVGDDDYMIDLLIDLFFEVIEKDKEDDEK